MSYGGLILQPEPIRIAVVGVGRFGSFHCGKIKSLPGVSLDAVVDLDPTRAGEAARRFGARALTRPGELAGRVQAAVVAVPTPEHHAVASELLRAGLDLLVEKPLAATSAQAAELVHLAETGKRFLQVGHLERFNPIVRAALPRIGTPRYVRYERLGPWPEQDVRTDVVLELMTHDLDLLLQLTQAPLVSISATGHCVASPYLDLVNARLEFADGLIADLSASRVHHRRSRVMTVLDEDGLIEVDLEGLKLWRSRALHGDLHCESLSLEPGDALMDQDRAFVEALELSRVPAVCGSAGEAAVRLAEQILSSIQKP